MRLTTTDIYFDFEFMEDGQSIIPISLGMCVGKLVEQRLQAKARELTHYAHLDPSPAELYIEYQFDFARANDWVRENVFPHLNSGEQRGLVGASRPDAARFIREWVATVCGDSRPKFWGYYPSYDWVCLMQHWGTLMQKPKGWPSRPICLKQEAEARGLYHVNFPAKPEDSHHALADTRWNRTLHEAIDVVDR